MRVYTNYAVAKKIAAEQSIHEAARELKKAAELMADCKPFHLAQGKIDECRVVGDETCARFWRSVWIHLVSVEYGIACL